MNKRKPRIIRDKSGKELSAEEIEQQEIRRTRLPRGNETLGIVDQRLGAGRLKVRCLDSKERVCRIPGRLKRFLWVRENDIVLIEPWELDSNAKGDVIFKYRRSQVDWLKKNGYLKDLTETDEF
ncbi:MAG: translation initiation factor eIF-1A [Candidatus Woesearchaeota archaeon]